jgi:small subunit ribosomal protein S9
METGNTFYATGKRKTAIARTWLTPGDGKIVINGKALEEHFPIEALCRNLVQPMVVTNTRESYDVRVRVTGGGVSGQSGAVRHGITRALIEADPDFRTVLKKAGFVRRDPRKKERKKYGQRGARARYQFSKR